MTLEENKKIGSLPTLYKTYEISFDIFPFGTTGNPDDYYDYEVSYDNVLHLTKGMVKVIILL